MHVCAITWGRQIQRRLLVCTVSGEYKCTEYLNTQQVTANAHRNAYLHTHTYIPRCMQ